MAVQDETTSGRPPRHYELVLAERMGTVGNPSPAHLKLVPRQEKQEENDGEK